jgi:hypothetical protein
MTVRVGEREAQMVLELELRGDAAHTVACNQPVGSQVLTAIQTPAAAWQFLPAVTNSIEDDEVEVNATVALRSAQDQAGGKARSDFSERLESDLA